MHLVLCARKAVRKTHVASAPWSNASCMQTRSTPPPAAQAAGDVASVVGTQGPSSAAVSPQAPTSATPKASPAKRQRLEGDGAKPELTNGHAALREKEAAAPSAQSGPAAAAPAAESAAAESGGERSPPAEEHGREAAASQPTSASAGGGADGSESPSRKSHKRRSVAGSLPWRGCTVAAVVA